MYIMYTVSILSIVDINKEHIRNIDLIIKISISIMLIYKFNPYSDIKNISKDDKQLIFDSGVFLLTTTGVHNVLRRFLNVDMKVIDNNDYLKNDLGNEYMLSV